MNGDETLSNLRSEICRNADARAMGLGELEELVHRWATAQNKAPMAERAAELAQAMTNCGADTWGGRQGVRQGHPGGQHRPERGRRKALREVLGFGAARPG